MGNFVRFIKTLFGKYETGYQYWVYLDEIKIPEDFKKTPPKFEKLSKKFDYFMERGELQSKIILTKDFTLVDGYTSVIVAEAYGIEKVPVWFIEG